MKEEFIPHIIAYCCTYCAYSAADLAGSMRIEYPANINIIRVPCTGKVDIIYLLKAIENGADGVYVAGCLEGECHFLKGNIRAKKRMGYAKKLLEDTGINPKRIAMYNLSSSQGRRFAEIAVEMNEKIKVLGPSPVKTGSGREYEVKN